VTGERAENSALAFLMTRAKDGHGILDEYRQPVGFQNRHLVFTPLRCRYNVF
jgi:hypothetical protein